MDSIISIQNKNEEEILNLLKDLREDRKRRKKERWIEIWYKYSQTM